MMAMLMVLPLVQPLLGAVLQFARLGLDLLRLRFVLAGLGREILGMGGSCTAAMSYMFFSGFALEEAPLVRRLVLEQHRLALGRMADPLSIVSRLATVAARTARTAMVMATLATNLLPE